MRWATAGDYVCKFGYNECCQAEKGKARTGIRDGGREKEREARRKKEGEKGREARGGLRKGRKARKRNKRKAGHIRKGRNAWSDGRESVEQHRERQKGTCLDVVVQL